MPSSTLMITPNWLRNDAVGNDVLGMVQTLHRDGKAVYAYVPHACAPAYREWLVDKDTARSMLADRGTAMIYHHSIGCHQAQELALNAQCEVRALRYHNVTPAHFFANYDPAAVLLCQEGRAALDALADHTTHVLVPSLFNAAELVGAGAMADAIVYQPCFHRLADIKYSRSDPGLSRSLLADRRLKVLFVGRRSPHKGHRHLIQAVAAYVRQFDREIVIHMVGGVDAACASYDQELRDLVEELGMRAEVEIHDKLDFTELLAFYRNSDVFLCLSEHEGFCIPIIEAQSCGLPVIAFAVGGVPEAMGPNQPFALATLDPIEVAKALRVIREDPAGARRIGQAGASSVEQRFGHGAVRRRFLQWFNSLPDVPEAGTEPKDAYDTPFDPDWYTQRYPDVRSSGLKPREHYDWIGRRLGRTATAASNAISA